MTKILRASFLCLLAAATAGAAVDPALMNLVMANATTLSGLQVDQSEASPFGQYILSRMQISDSSFQKLIASTGFDPRRDLHEILAATDGDTSSGLVLGRGNFQPTQIAAAAQAGGASLVPYNGFTIISEPGSKDSLAILDASTAVMGATDQVKAAIDRRNAGTKFSGALASQANQVSNSNQAWFVTQGPLSQFLNGKLNNGNLGNLNQAAFLSSITAASGGVNFGATAVSLTADAVTTSNQNAQALVDVLQFLASMIQTNKGTDPVAGRVASLADAAKFTANGTVMHMTLTLPEQQVEQLLMPPPAKTNKAAVK